MFKRLWVYLRFVARRFVEDRCLMIAGSLTYTSLLALVPLFTVTLVLTARLPYVRGLINEVHTFALKNLVPDVAGKVVGVYMEQFAQNAARLTAIGIAILVVTAIALLFTIDGAFNDIWRAKRRHSWWKRLSGYLAVLALGPLLIGASLTISSALVRFSRKFERVFPFLDDGLLRLIPFVLTTGALVLAYRVLPARHVPMRHAVLGGLVAGLLFEVVKLGFVEFVLRVPTYSLVYGAFASVPMFLAWLFCCWMVVLVGAEIAATLSYFRHDSIALAVVSGGVASTHTNDALRIVNALGSNDKGLTLTALRFQVPLPIDITEEVLHALTEANLLRVDKGNHFRLALARESISDEEVARAVRGVTL